MRRNSLFARALVRRYLCARCEGGLVERVIDDQWVVVCGRDATHEGKHTMRFVKERHQQSLTEGLEIRAAFPELVEQPRRSAAEAYFDLYGEEIE